METWIDKYNYFMVDLRDPRYGQWTVEIRK